MAITTVRCHVSGERVIRVSDFEGAVVRISCPYLDPGSNTCRAQRDVHGSGRLGEFLERAEEGTLESRDDRCEML
jgi:hypothetical protein